MSAAESKEQPLIQLRGVTKVYGEGALAFQALKGVDLDIARGDFVAIMGPGGSGKSTAMNTLGCLDRPTTGQYLFQGVPVESLGRDQRALLRRRYFGFVFQGFNLLARTSAQENVELPLLYRGETALARRAASARALEAVAQAHGWLACGRCVRRGSGLCIAHCVHSSCSSSMRRMSSKSATLTGWA